MNQSYPYFGDQAVLKNFASFYGTSTVTYLPSVTFTSCSMKSAETVISGCDFCKEKSEGFLIMFDGLDNGVCPKCICKLLKWAYQGYLYSESGYSYWVQTKKWS